MRDKLDSMELRLPSDAVIEADERRAKLENEKADADGVRSWRSGDQKAISAGLSVARSLAKGVADAATGGVASKVVDGAKDAADAYGCKKG